MKGFGPKLKPQYARLVKLAKTGALQASGRSSNLLPSTNKVIKKNQNKKKNNLGATKLSHKRYLVGEM